MSNEHGQVTILAVGLALLAFATSGLAIDGTRAFLFRRSLQNAADAASLAGAAELDTGRYYSSSGSDISVDPVAAHEVASKWLHLRGIDARAKVLASRDRVTIVLRGRLPTTFLGLIGIASVPVAVVAASEPRVGF